MFASRAYSVNHSNHSDEPTGLFHDMSIIKDLAVKEKQVVLVDYS